jgi:hypothetical protein
VADSKVSGARNAMLYLPDLGDDLPPTALAVLVRAVKRDDRPREMAAITLANLGERARAARRELEGMGEDRAIGWIIDSALRRIPAHRR